MAVDGDHDAGFKLMPKQGEQVDPAQLSGLIAVFFVFWVAAMVLSTVGQIFAVKWMLKTTWSDFRLVAVGPLSDYPTDAFPRTKN